MKAVIMAGGEGTRLRPLSLGRPKPMTPLLGRPVMGHIITLLKKHGITDICVTLCYRPQEIMDFFGDGSQIGVHLTYFVEQKPLGTAGSVKNCMGHLGGEDFLVISGDCVCDLDLGRLAAFHRERGAAATLALYRHPTPLEYGLVYTDASGKISRFVEKPSWGQVTTNFVNTGIYVLSPQAMERVPEQGAFDFGKDLFPGLLEGGIPLYGCPLEGYWCDMGDCGAYLDCVRDALAGKVKLDMGLPQRAPGVWAAEPVPAGVSLTAPCWIDRGVSLATGAKIGPNAALSRGASVGSGAQVQRCVLLEDASAGPGALLDGAVLCRGAAARTGAVLNPGTVLGENALAEEGAVLLERVRLWPGQTAPAGGCLSHSVTSGSQKGILHFDAGGVIRGVPGEDLGPEALMALGSALGAEGDLGLGCSDTPAARMLAQAAAAGAAAAGGRILSHGLSCPAQGAWAAEAGRLPVSLFVEESGAAVYLHLFDGQGLPLERARTRKLEHALLQGEARRVHAGQVGRVERQELTDQQWARETVRRARLGRPALRRVTAAVGNQTAEDRALGQALAALGCRIEAQWRPGIPAFHASRGGFRLTAQDERGAVLDPGQLLALVTLIEMENGSGAVAVPAQATAAVDLVAAGYSGRVLRLDRDGAAARERYAAMPWLREAASAAVRICSRMEVAGQKLETLISKTPRFSAWTREVPLSSDRGQVMQTLAREQPRASQGEGLRLHVGGGWVYLVPLARRPALRVMAEGPDLEIAADLCDFYAGRAAQADRAISEQCAQEDDKAK